MRLMHTMLRVLDLDRSIEFYQGILGMRLLKKLEFPDGKLRNRPKAFLTTTTKRTRRVSLSSLFTSRSPRVVNLMKSC